MNLRFYKLISAFVVCSTLSAGCLPASADEETFNFTVEKLNEPVKHVKVPSVLNKSPDAESTSLCAAEFIKTTLATGSYGDLVVQTPKYVKFETDQNRECNMLDVYSFEATDAANDKFHGEVCVRFMDVHSFIEDPRTGKRTDNSATRCFLGGFYPTGPRRIFHLDNANNTQILSLRRIDAR